MFSTAHRKVVLRYFERNIIFSSILQ